MDALDQLPTTGVQITVMIFGGLSLLILGGGLFLAGRRHHPTPLSDLSDLSDLSKTTTSRILTDLILSQQARQGFDRGAIGQPPKEGGEFEPPGR